MAKLNRRQMIILAVMCIVVLYAAYDWLGPSGGKKKTAVQDITEDKTAFIGSLTSGVGNKEDALRITYAVSMAETQWWNDPFLERSQYLAWVQSKGTDALAAKEGKMSFAYTGFVEMKGKRMAIINGDEYATGEKLLTNRHILKFIDPAKVIIEDLSTRQDMTVLFQE